MREAHLLPHQPGRGADHELASHLQRTDLAAHVAQYGLVALSELYIHATRKATDALVAADDARRGFEQQGGAMSKLEEAAFAQMRAQYLAAMERVLAIATTQIVRDVMDAPRPLPPRGR